MERTKALRRFATAHSAQKRFAAHALFLLAKEHLRSAAHDRALKAARELKAKYPNALALSRNGRLSSSHWRWDPYKLAVYLDRSPHPTSDGGVLVEAEALISLKKKQDAMDVLGALVRKRAKGFLEEVDRRCYGGPVPRPHRLALKRLLILKAGEGKADEVGDLFDRFYLKWYFPDDDRYLVRLAKACAQSGHVGQALKVLRVGEQQLQRRIQAVEKGKDTYIGDERDYWHTPKLVKDPKTGEVRLAAGERFVADDPKDRAEWLKTAKLRALRPRLATVEAMIKQTEKAAHGQVKPTPRSAPGK